MYKGILCVIPATVLHGRSSIRDHKDADDEQPS
jgi:hypothetical protein